MGEANPEFSHSALFPLTLALSFGERGLFFGFVGCSLFSDSTQRWGLAQFIRTEWVLINVSMFSSESIRINSNRK